MPSFLNRIKLSTRRRNHKQLSSRRHKRPKFEPLENRQLLTTLALEANPDVLHTDEDSLVSSIGLFSEAFASDVVGEAAFENAYAPLDFRAPGGGEIAVSGGVVELTGPADAGTQEVVLGDFSGDLRVSVDIGGATVFPGVSNVGLRIGENNIVFHPGTSPGLLRVEGPGGFDNQETFPARSFILHNLTVDVAAATGVFTLTLTDGFEPNNVFSTTFTNPDWNGGEIALRRNGPGIFNGDTQVGLFDNPVVSTDTLLNNDGFLPEKFETELTGEARFETTYAPLDFRGPDGGDVAVIGGVAELTGTALDTAQEIVLGD